MNSNYLLTSLNYPGVLGVIGPMFKHTHTNESLRIPSPPGRQVYELNFGPGRHFQKPQVIIPIQNTIGPLGPR